MWSPVTPAAAVAAEADTGADSSSRKGTTSSRTPSSRAKHSVTLHGPHLYLLAGRNGNIALKDLWRYSLSEGDWSLLDPTGERPPCLQEHTAVSYGDAIWVFGGEVGFSASNEPPLWVYSLKNNSWRKVHSCKGALVPKGRRGHTALVHRSTMVIYGGYQDLRGSSSELWVFHFESESWHLISNGRNSAPARHKHSMVLHDGSLWIYGGMTDLQEKSELWKFDTVRKTWTQIKSKMGPGALHSHAVCKLPSSMLVFGGERGGQPNNELWRFHFATETWEKLTVEGSGPGPRTESVALLIPDSLLTGNSCVSKKSSPPKRLQSGSRSIERQSSVKCQTPRSTTTPGSSNISILKEISKLSQLNLTRLTSQSQGGSKCNYSVLSSTESISETSLNGSEMVKSQSANIIAKSLISPSSDEITTPKTTALPRDPISVPNFTSLQNILTPVEVSKLVYLTDDEEVKNDGQPDFSSLHSQMKPKNFSKKSFPKSASVRFGNPLVTPEEISETSDYASMETMNRISTDKCKKDGPYSFANPHYMGPDIKDIITENDYSILASPLSRNETSGNNPGKSNDMIEMKPIPPKSLPLELNNSYNNQLNCKKVRANSASRVENEKSSFSVFILGGKERGQVTVFKRPISIWKLQLDSSVF